MQDSSGGAMPFVNRCQLIAVLITVVLSTQLVSRSLAYTNISTAGEQYARFQPIFPSRPGDEAVGWSAFDLAANVASNEANDWSKAMVESTMKRYPTATDLGSWGYAKSLYLWGQYLVWQRTRDPRYLKYIKEWVDSHVDANGTVTNTSADGKITEIAFDNLDSMLPGNLLLVLYRETKDQRYKL